MDHIGNLVVLVLILFFYFMPALNAAERKHNSATAIFVANLLLGWTVLGWIVCLIWSFSGQRGGAKTGEASPETHVRCPECRELVIRDARKCKHCGCALIPQ